MRIRKKDDLKPDTGLEMPFSLSAVRYLKELKTLFNVKCDSWKINDSEM
jgi:hypothetical protein